VELFSCQGLILPGARVPIVPANTVTYQVLYGTPERLAKHEGAHDTAVATSLLGTMQGGKHLL